jgi:hypothetical protein
MVLELVLGLGIVSFLLLYFAFNLNAEGGHFLLKLLMVFFFFAILMLIPKATLDAKTNCEFVVSNVTVSAPTDLYEYEEKCSTTTTTTERTFLNTILWLTRLFALYFICYLFYDWARRSEFMLNTFFGGKKE